MSRIRRITAAVITAAALTGGVAWGAVAAGAPVTASAPASYGQDTHLWG